MALKEVVQQKCKYLAISTAPAALLNKLRYIAGDDFKSVQAEVEKEAKAFGLSFEIYLHLTSAVTTVSQTTVKWGGHHGD